MTKGVLYEHYKSKKKNCVWLIASLWRCTIHFWFWSIESRVTDFDFSCTVILSCFFPLLLGAILIGFRHQTDSFLTVSSIGRQMKKETVWVFVGRQIGIDLWSSLNSSLKTIHCAVSDWTQWKRLCLTKQTSESLTHSAIERSIPNALPRWRPSQSNIVCAI